MPPPDLSAPFEPAKLASISELAVVPPIIGRICTGHAERRSTPGGVRALPAQDHAFHVTTLVQRDDLSWTPHPLEASLRESPAEAGEAPALTRIPVRIAYDALPLNLQNRYVCYDGKGRPACLGDGVRARRVIDGTMEDIDCPRPERCQFGMDGRCRHSSRVLLRIEGQTDTLGVFALRTSSYNTTQYLGARLLQLHSGLQGQIAGLPMDLIIRQKTSVASFRQPFSFVDLVEREALPLSQAIEMGRQWRQSLSAMGFCQATMEAGLCAALARSRYALGEDELEDEAAWPLEDALAERLDMPTPMKGLDHFTRKSDEAAEGAGLLGVQPAPVHAPADQLSGNPGGPAPDGTAPSIPAVARDAPPTFEVSLPTRASSASEQRTAARSPRARTSGPASARPAVLKSTVPTGRPRFF